MDRFAFNLRSDILDASVFETEFDELWNALMNDDDALRGMVSERAMTELQTKPRSELIIIRSGSTAGLTGVEQVIIEATVSGIASALVTWILDRMKRGRPDNAIQRIDLPVTGTSKQQPTR